MAAEQAAKLLAAPMHRKRRCSSNRAQSCVQGLPSHLHDGVRALPQILAPRKAQQHGAQSEGLLRWLQMDPAQAGVGSLDLLPQCAQLRAHHLRKACQVSAC